MSGRAELVLYDADCGLCSRLAAWLARHGIPVSPIRSAAGDVALRDLTSARREATLHVVDGAGRRRSGAEALPPILRSLPRLSWAARVLEAVPAPLQVGYALVARHRGRLSRLAHVDRCETR